MALIDNKITDNDVNVKGVVAAPDRMLGTADENKRVFDRLIREAVKGKLNQLIDNLRELGVEHIIRSVDGEGNITYLRVGADGLVETSTDGINWGTTALKALAERVHADAESAESAKDRAVTAETAAGRSQYYAEQAAQSTSEDYRLTDLAKGQAESARDNARDEADRAGREADRARDEADRAGTNSGNARDEADRAGREADRARDEADRAESEADRAEGEADRAEGEADRAGAAAAEAVQSERMRNDKQDARLANLEAAALGKLYREEVDDSVAYVKPVPAGALPYAAITDVESVELDGVTYYPTAVMVHGINWLPSTVDLRSGAINTSTGAKQDSSSNVYTYSWIDVSLLRGKSITYSFTSTSTSAIGMAFYTAKNNDSFISGKAIKNGATVVVPSNANYARFTFRASDAQPMVVLGDSLPEVRVPGRKAVSYDIDSLPVYVAVQPGESISIANDMGVPVPMPGSVTYAINVQEAISNE